MKIQVGKTYTAVNGSRWYIECQLKNNLLVKDRAGMFLATDDGIGKTGYNIYKEDGYCENTNMYSYSGFQLLPNKVKKKGYINIYDVSHTETFDTDRIGVEIFPSKEAAVKGIETNKINGFKCLDTVEITWEEEE